MQTQSCMATKEAIERIDAELLPTFVREVDALILNDDGMTVQGYGTEAMYSVFDTFLKVATWHTSHANDETRFFTALHKVVSDDEFNPDAMAEYMCAKLKLDKDDHGNHFVSDVMRLRSAAWSVKDYLTANNM